jgi:hypothetical protein
LFEYFILLTTLLSGLARPSSEERAGLCGGALDGLAFFGSFWGNAKKNELLIIKKLLNQDQLLSTQRMLLNK